MPRRRRAARPDRCSTGFSRRAFQAAKHVRTHTAIGEGQISVASVAVDLALKIFGDLQPCHVLVLGAGDIGEKTARAFKSRGAGR
jgi:glutamyl-tRNA reductase